MKHEWRKKEKHIYIPKNKPEYIQVPRFKYLTISGEGSPDTEHFSDCITALYTLAYTIKMNLKNVEPHLEGYIDFTVYPLEGIWGLNEEAQKNFNGTINKEDFVFELMIRQPDFVSNDFFNEMLEIAKKKKPHHLLDSLVFREIEDGPSIQMMHIGSFDSEPESFQLMEEFANKNGLTRVSKIHREVYLSDFRKVPTEKLKTILRFKATK